MLLSYMAFSSDLSFLLFTHIIDCASYCPFTTLIVPFSSVHCANCALFLPFTTLIVPFWRSAHHTKRALLRWHPALLKTWAEHLCITTLGNLKNWTSNLESSFFANNAHTTRTFLFRVNRSYWTKRMKYKKQSVVIPLFRVMSLCGVICETFWMRDDLRPVGVPSLVGVTAQSTDRSSPHPNTYNSSQRKYA